jgi:hypothetical protein
MTLDSYQQPSVGNAHRSLLIPKGKDVGALPVVVFRVILVSMGPICRDLKLLPKYLSRCSMMPFIFSVSRKP